MKKETLDAFSKALWRFCVSVLTSSALSFSSPVYAQISPAEHAAHHPGAAGAPPPAGTAPAGGGMMEQMGEMMRGMGAPPRKEFYPELMDLPDVPPERWDEIQIIAHNRMQSGMNLLSQGVSDLSSAWSADDLARMQSAVIAMKEGLSQFESGLSAHRLLAEGNSPRSVALTWFKQQMNLTASSSQGLHIGPSGISPFHFVVMLILVLFSITMLFMYFFKMRRAAFLLQQLTSPGRPSGGPTGGVPPTSPPPGTAPSSPPSNTPPSNTSQNSASAGAAQAEQSSGGAPIDKWSGQLKVAAVFQETPSVKTFRLVNPSGGPIPFNYLPGHFLTLSVNVDGKTHKRAYTIASSPTQRFYYELTIKREEQGIVSRFLHDRLAKGDLLDVTGPGGVFTFTGREANSIVLIGGGVGITPLMSIIRFLTDTCWEGKIYLLYACRSPADIIFREELGQLQARNPNLQQFITVTRAVGTTWSGLRGYFSKQAISLCIPDIASIRVHLCGPIPMMDGVKTVLAELGVPQNSIKTEAFGPEKKQAVQIIAERKSAPTIVSTSTTATFSRSNKTAFLPPTMSVLEAAESVGVEIDNSCRMGTCGLCKVKLLSGHVTMAVEDALEPEEKAGGLILACQAKSAENVVVEA